MLKLVVTIRNCSFQNHFPKRHRHPKSSFAIEKIASTGIYLLNKVELGKPDQFDYSIAVKPETNETIKYGVVRNFVLERYCGFCNENQENILSGPFFKNPLFLCDEINAAEYFWVHMNCAKFSPEVYNTGGKWFNIIEAVRRSRQNVQFVIY